MTSAKTALIVAAAVSLVFAARVCAAPNAASKELAKSTASAKSNSQSGIEMKGRSALFGPYSMQVGRGVNIRAKFGFTKWSPR